MTRSLPEVPVITIDGPTASGKGTVAQGVAQTLGWHVLDSGALYRLTALAVHLAGVDPGDTAAVAETAQQLDASFHEGQVFLQGRNVTDDIRAEGIGSLASQIAARQPVRDALLARQRAFATAPGLVADGRDMGTVIFPQAPLKIFLEADAVSRAKRRHKQLLDKGISANISHLAEEMRLRDSRDRNRASAPLVAAPDAHTIDSSNLSVDETIREVLKLWAKTTAGGGSP